MSDTAYDIRRMREDMRGRGWRARDLARAAQVSDATIHRFLIGKFQNPHTALKLAVALGHPLRRYVASRRVA